MTNSVKMRRCWCPIGHYRRLCGMSTLVWSWAIKTFHHLTKRTVSTWALYSSSLLSSWSLFSWTCWSQSWETLLPRGKKSHHLSPPRIGLDLSWIIGIKSQTLRISRHTSWQLLCKMAMRMMIRTCKSLKISNWSWSLISSLLIRSTSWPRFSQLFLFYHRSKSCLIKKTKRKINSILESLKLCTKGN